MGDAGAGLALVHLRDPDGERFRHRTGVPLIAHGSSALLVLRGFSRHLGIACSTYSWSLIASHQERSAPAFREQIVGEGIDAAIFRPKQDLPPFKGNVLDFHSRFLVAGDARVDPVSSDDAAWIAKRFETFNRLAAESEPFRLALEAAIDWRFTKEPRLAAKSKKAAAKPAAKKPKDLIARAVLEALAKKGGKARYVGTREKFENHLVNVLSVRSEDRHGYDARVKFSDGVSMYVRPTSLKQA